MIKKITLATLGGFVALFLLGGLIYGALLGSYMEEAMKAGAACMNNPMNMTAVVVANLVQALLFAILIHKLGISTFSSGMIVGAWLGFALGVFFDMWMFATFNFMTVTLMGIDVVVYTVMGAVTGGVIGWILGKV